MRSRRRSKVERPLTGTITVPGDKSISHRAVMLAACSAGRSVLEGVNTGGDVLASIRAMEAMGVTMALDEDDARLEVEGYGWDGLIEPQGVLDLGNSGTTMRTLLGILAATPGLFVLTGDPSLRGRPMLRVVAPLRQMGARIDGRAHGDRAPLVVRGGELEAVDIALTVASAQIKTALLFAGLRTSGHTRVTEPAPSRDHTERILGSLGVPIEIDGTSVAVEGPVERLDPVDRSIPGDLSSALFMIAAACIVEGSDLEITNVGLNPTRTAALDVMRAMGADIEVSAERDEGGEPVGSVRARHSELQGFTIEGDVVPRLIDEIPILCVLAAFAHGESRVSGAGELRVKESDRIEAISAGLGALGCDATPSPDGLLIRGGTRPSGGEVDSRGDHRIAMSFAVAGLASEGNVSVSGWSAVESSFPSFLDVLGRAQDRL